MICRVQRSARASLVGSGGVVFNSLAPAYSDRQKSRPSGSLLGAILEIRRRKP